MYALFHGLGRLSYLLIGKRRKLALKNTEIAFPERSPAERKRIVYRHFINLADSMALNTLIMAGRISNERILSMVEAEHWEILETHCRNEEKGPVVYSAHMGNWELLPQYIALRLQANIHVVARESDNPLLEQKVIKPLRERFGVNVFYKKNAMLKIMQASRRKEISGLLIDQRLNPPFGIMLEFFGREAGTTPAPAQLQFRCGLTLIPLFMVRTGHQKYRLIIKPPVPWTDTGAPLDEQVKALSLLQQKVIEEMITEYPEQWFLVHNRWGLKKNSL